jgi:uncharacterized protein YukE
MTRIRVDTEELRKSAKELAASADNIGRAGDEILAVAMALPSYDGQLSGPARKGGYEIESQMKQIQNKINGDSNSLTWIAESFKKADAEMVAGISLQKLILANINTVLQRSSGLVSSNGNHTFGYKDFGEYVILWKNGQSNLVYKNDRTRIMLTQYCKRVDDCLKFGQKIVDIYNNMLMQGLAILPMVFLFLASTYGALVKLLGKTFPQIKAVLIFTDKMFGLIGKKLSDILEGIDIKTYDFDPMAFGQEKRIFAHMRIWRERHIQMQMESGIILIQIPT